MNLEQRLIKLESIADKQSQLLQILEDQIIDLASISKAELGDDVISEIWRLTKEINELKRQQDVVRSN